MNRTEHELELMRRYLDGVASLEETQELEALIVKDASVRQDFLRYAHLDSALAGVRRSQPAVGGARRSVWLSWRPLTAAAAGIAFGMFCTSMVFAYVAPLSGKVLTLLHEGFEHSPQLVQQAFPTEVGQWSVDTGALVGPERGASPKEGGHMLRLEPKADDKFTRAHYVVNLRQIPAFSRSGAHQAQFRVSFRPALIGKTDRYVLRAATFSRGLAQIEPEWMKGGWAEVQDRALSYAAQGGGVSKGTEDWTTMTLSINVPAEANLMVLSLWAASMEEKREDRGAHYVDGITLSFLTSEPLP
jgi:hypothetical protein